MLNRLLNDMSKTQRDLYRALCNPGRMANKAQLLAGVTVAEQAR